MPEGFGGHGVVRGALGGGFGGSLGQGLGVLLEDLGGSLGGLGVFRGFGGFPGGDGLSLGVSRRGSAGGGSWEGWRNLRGPLGVLGRVPGG